MDKERLIEMYVGQQTSDCAGTWHISDVWVPYNLGREEAIALAEEKLQEALAQQTVAFIGLYSYWDDENMADFWDFDEEFDEGED